MLRVHGLYGHARRNDALALAMLGAFVAAIQILGALVLILPLLLLDSRHLPYADPGGYLLRYGLPVAAAAGALYLWHYRRHARQVQAVLDYRFVDRFAAPRLMRIAEDAAQAQGLLTPRVAILEAEARNAMALGSGRRQAVLVVTRGLLRALDDDELGAVIAHEFAHVRLRDTRLIASAWALSQSLLTMQRQNPLRIEDWRQILLFIVFPPYLVLLLGSGLLATLALVLGRSAHHVILSARDHVADAEAVRMTHDAGALISALGKVAGRGAFPGCERFDSLLFDGFAKERKGTHPPIEERLAAIRAHAGALAAVPRTRRDTRGEEALPVAAAVRGFGRRGVAAVAVAAAAPAPVFRSIHDDPARDAMLEWGVDADRNWLGIRPHLRLPVAVGAVFTLVLYFPGPDGRSIGGLGLNPLVLERFAPGGKG